MQVITGFEARQLTDLASQAKLAEQLGFDGLSFAEATIDPFLPCTVALEHTQSIAVGTSIALAFPRSPMSMAYTAWTLQALGKGRFTLGLGTQVRGHIQRRYSVPWVAPAARMREYILSLRAIFACWQSGTPLQFAGKHYQFSLMTPDFSPSKLDTHPPRIAVAAVGPAITRLAGEMCDGVILHPFTTAKYVQEVTLPNLEQGAQRAGRGLRDVAITGGGFIITGPSQADVNQRYEEARRRVAFYASTRSYHGVLEVHGWRDIGVALYRLSVQGQWDKMPALVSDAMMDAFCVTGTYDVIARRIRDRYASYATAINLSLPPSAAAADLAAVRQIIKDIHTA